MSNNLKFSINSTSESPAKTNIQVRGFTLTVDEPAELGGTDVAPNPVEYILAGYAGCINVVAHIVAKELDITLNDLKVDIEGYLNPNRLFGVSSAERAGYSSIKVNLKTTTQLDKTTKEQWLSQIEDRCPVNDNLTNKTPINFLFNN